jgi:predicted transcriptional regulator
MAKKDLHLLTDLQLAIMREVWKRGTASVTDVHASLSRTPAWPRNPSAR